MAEHEYGQADVDAGGGRSVRCSCGQVLSGPDIGVLGALVEAHLAEVGAAPTCRECGGELVDWSSTRDYVEAEDGLCGRCRLDRMGSYELGQRRRS